MAKNKAVKKENGVLGQCDKNQEKAMIMELRGDCKIL